jgi:hypothetical protein
MTVNPPSTAALQDAAIQISKLLRDAKVDAPLRPKALAALLLAAAHGGLKGNTRSALAQINRQVAAAIAATTLPATQQRRLVSTLRLDADFDRLALSLPAIASLLDQIDVAHALHSDFDFLGIFYEAFLRYGYDNNALGIVFTPRHITRFCVDLLGVGAGDRVIDIACGTGGFLVPAYERMCSAQPAGDGQARGVVRGFDTNPTVWALAVLNMTFRACRSRAEKSAGPDCRIEFQNCFEALRGVEVRRNFTRAFLNPPFSQGAEPERDFLDAAMDSLQPGGNCAAVVKAGIFADEEHAAWRVEFLRRHTLLAIISLPEDLFYPTSAPTSILVAAAHLPQPADRPVLMARVWNDGFEKLKNRRVGRDGSELDEVNRSFRAAQAGQRLASRLAVTVAGEQLRGGKEWSPQEWLPHPEPETAEQQRRDQGFILASVFRAVVDFPELAEVAQMDFTHAWHDLPPLPLGRQAPLEEFFQVSNGRSAGERHYRDGATPYISSGGQTNSIMRLVEPEEEEIFLQGGITVTAFGQASLQPWAFLARGNGGSAVRVLVPRYRMAVPELAWFAAQINAQKWRFFYARMAIKSRIERLVLTSPKSALLSPGQSLAGKIRAVREKLEEFSRI